MSKRNKKKSQVVQQRFQLPKALVGIIITSFRRIDLLKLCLEAVPAACGDISYEIVVFDNGSPQEETKGFYDQLKEQPKIKIIRSKERLGFSSSNNTAVRHCLSPIYFFINDDVILHPGSVSKMVRKLDDPKVGVVGMKLIFPENNHDPERPTGKVQHVGISTNIRGETFHHFIGWSPNNAKVNAVNEVFAVTGAALMVRRNLFWQVGGFLPAYDPGYYEDIDLCVSIHKLGYNIVVEPQATGFHYTNASMKTSGPATPLSPTNRWLFMQRHGQGMEYTEWKIW